MSEFSCEFSSIVTTQLNIEKIINIFIIYCVKFLFLRVMTEKLARSEQRGMCGLLASNVVDVEVSSVLFMRNSLIKDEKKVLTERKG